MLFLFFRPSCLVKIKCNLYLLKSVQVPFFYFKRKKMVIKFKLNFTVNIINSSCEFASQLFVYQRPQHK